MTIALKNQYICKFDLGDLKDFIQATDFKGLLYVEDAEMALPALELSFTLRDEKVLDYINEGYILSLGIGLNELSMLDIKFRIITDFKSKRPSVGQNITLSGVYYDYDYTACNKIDTFENKSSLEVLNVVVPKHFSKLVTNIEKTNDRQNWQQHENTWSFLKRVCLNSYINNKTFIVSAFDNDTFYFYDFRKLLSESSQNLVNVWTFSKSATSDRTGKIITYNNAIYSGGSGITSQALGHQQVCVEYNWEDYTTNLYLDNLVSFTSLDTKALPLAYTGSLNFNYRSLNSGESAISNMATTQNARNQIMNSNIQIFVTLGGQFKKLKLLDIALFDRTADSQIAGLSVISRIAYQITNQQLYTNVTLVRENFNNAKGEGLQDGSD